MILIMLGPPGAGKGTQAEKLMKVFSIPQISTGDMIRTEIKAASSLGKKVKEIVDAGHLVSDDIMIELIKHRISKDDSKNGFILDGFPRTSKQAEELDKLLNSLKKQITAVLNFDISEEEVVKRISSRRTCLHCGASYNIFSNPSKSKDVCDKCSSKIVQRDDDKEETVRKRLNIYKEKTQPLINYYREKKLLIDVDATRDIDVIHQNLADLLKNKK